MFVQLVYEEDEMQTAKVKAGQSYAVKYGSELCEFRCQEVETRRTIHSVSNKFIGKLVLGGQLIDRKYDPDDLLGPFEEYSELVAKKQAEDAAREAAKRARDAEDERVFRGIVKALGVTLSKNESTYNQPIRATYGGTIEIGRELAKLLLAKLEKNHGPRHNDVVALVEDVGDGA